ncbi:MAG: RDD family protein [Chloroflexaceae bacterium]|nr:RDD family protein [Chloroflexaceae bacterium]
MIDERYTVDTPENIAFSYAIAGIASRFLAAMIDTFLLLLVQVVLVLTLVFLSGLVDAPQSEQLVVAAWGILSFGFLWGYYLFFELLWNGQTPGKRLIRLRVVREGGRPVTFVASAIRNLVRFVDFLPGFYGLGVLTMFIDQRSRRLGDLAGGTLVVKDRVAVSLESLVAQTRPLELVPPGPGPTLEEAAGAAPFTPTVPNLHLLTRDDYELVQEFLRRRRELGRESAFAWRPG